MKNLSNSENFKKATAFTGKKKLPVGAYKLKINDVKYIDNSSKGYANQIVLAFDIADGEFKDFYKQDFENNKNEDKKWKGTYRYWEPTDDGSEKDGWAQSRLKNIIRAFEESNNGYIWDWDENSLKGKVVGAIFNEKEYYYEGRHGFFTQCYSLIPVSEIPNASIPEPTMLKNKASGGGSSDTSFMEINTSAEEIPF